MAKVNWAEVKKDYVTDETQSYASLSVKYGVSETAIAERASKELWVEKRKETLAKVEEKLIEKTTDEIAEVNARHIKLAKLLQGKGLEAITKKKIEPRSYKDARESIVAGIAVERQALGVDRKDSNVNVNVGVILPSWYRSKHDNTN